MNELSEWFTAQELARKEYMPSTARRAKDKLEALTEKTTKKKTETRLKSDRVPYIYFATFNYKRFRSNKKM